ncbi:MAG: LysR family transcriptional regulator, partial [Streptomyces sp.]|nr:LysR family transcriptional regulator [Streptomyces sp.]
MAPDHPARREVEAVPSVLVATPGHALVCAPASAGLGAGVVPEMVARTAATRLLEVGTLRR